MLRILHISDIHFGPPHVDARDSSVLALAAEGKPDLVVVSGDLTQRAKPDQFRQARRFVDRFSAPTIVVPGNHDVPLYRFWERFFSPYGAYRASFHTNLEPVVETKAYVAVGINTAHGWTIDNGRFRSSTLRRVDELLRQVPDSALKIVVAHHNLVAPQRFDRLAIARNAKAAAELFSRRGVDLVLSGHNHQSFLANLEDYYPTGRSAVPVLHSGTTTSDRGRGRERQRNSCFWIEVGERTLAVEQLLWEPDLDRFAVHSRHVLPRRSQQPGALDDLATESAAANR